MIVHDGGDPPGVLQSRSRLREPLGIDVMAGPLARSIRQQPVTKPEALRVVRNNRFDDLNLAIMQLPVGRRSTTVRSFAGIDIDIDVSGDQWRIGPDHEVDLDDALDNSTNDHVMVYFNAGFEPVRTIGRTIGPVLLPHAQAFMCRLVRGPEDAERGEDPASLIAMVSPTMESLLHGGQCL